jgi:hypothetical protein
MAMRVAETKNGSVANDANRFGLFIGKETFVGRILK